MNTLLKRPLQWIFLVSAMILVGFSTADKPSIPSETGNAIVLIAFKALPNKGAQTVSELTKLLEQVKEEPHFVSIKMHVDPTDDTNILLYEEWDDLSYYQSDHMETDHIKAFQASSTSFLTGPPEISFWHVERVFE